MHPASEETLRAPLGTFRHSIAEAAEPLRVALFAQHAFSSRLTEVWHTRLPFHHEASDSHTLEASDCIYTPCTSFHSRDGVQIGGATPALQGRADSTRSVNLC